MGVRGFAATLLGLGLLGAVAVGYGARTLFATPGPLRAPATIVIPRGAPALLADDLAERHVIDNAWVFRAAVWLSGRDGPLRAGEFTFPAHASVADVLNILRTARPVQHKLTIPEGLTAAQVALLLDRTDALQGDTPVPPEGSVMPLTYVFERGMPRAALVERATRDMDRALQDTWDTRDDGLPLASKQDMLILASIIERETSRPEERAHVASVYLNRLRKGMRLQADPTVAYGVTGGMGTHDHVLTRADLDRPGPYNTYRQAGLPASAIALPGQASMTAAAHPQPSDDLYFVADGNGGHVFAVTVEDHNRNVARWRSQTAPKQP